MRNWNSVHGRGTVRRTWSWTISRNRAPGKFNRSHVSPTSLQRRWKDNTQGEDVRLASNVAALQRVGRIRACRGLVDDVSASATRISRGKIQLRETVAGERIKSDQRSTWKWIRVQLKRLEQFANAIALVIYRTIINDRVVNRVYLIASAGSARARVCAQIYQNVGEHSHPIKGSSNDRPPRTAHSSILASRNEIFPFPADRYIRRFSLTPLKKIFRTAKIESNDRFKRNVKGFEVVSSI